MKSPYSYFLNACVIAVIAGAALSSCSVSPEGPAMSGASNGALGSANMSDYYYKRQAGWTYTFQCVEHTYDADGNVTGTYQGPNEYVKTMGFDGFAPGGDSLFRYQIIYQITSDYDANGTQPPFDINYIPSTKSDKTHGAFVLPGNTVDGMKTMDKRPRPVSTDTILAGVAGHIRTMTGNFDGTSPYELVTEMDTCWLTAHLDSVYLWERQVPGGPLVKERCIFIRNFISSNTWVYDVINNPDPTTYNVVKKADQDLTVGSTYYPHVVDIRIKTSEVDDKDFNREDKFYACGTGIVYQYDWWYTTTDGDTFVKKDFQRSLISLTHN